MEIDFVGMTNRINAWKRTAQANEDKRHLSGYTNAFAQPFVQHNRHYAFSESDQMLDENLISVFMGWKTRYNEYGQIIEGDAAPMPQSTKPVSQKEIDDYEAHCDLFWWYAKQDMYQSIISGNRLLYASTTFFIRGFPNSFLDYLTNAGATALPGHPSVDSTRSMERWIILFCLWLALPTSRAKTRQENRKSLQRSRRRPRRSAIRLGNR